MNYALVGYGRMGRAVETAAAGRGHRLVRIVDPTAQRPAARKRLDPARLGSAQVAFEFTRPERARENVLALLEAGVPVVSGTTGWRPDAAVRRAARGPGAVVAPNFSVGVNLFFEIVRFAARRLAGSGLYQPFVIEQHHAGKLDTPSGTARRLAETVARTVPGGGAVLEGPAPGPLAADTVHVASVRAGHEPGRHAVGFDGEFDRLELRHEARGRQGLALGAVLAAEWLCETGRGGGLVGFERVLRDLLLERGRSPRRERRR